MKTFLRSRPLFVVLFVCCTLGRAHALPRWPDVANVSAKMSIYQDYEQPHLFYYIPKGIQVSKSDQGVKMINHGIFYEHVGRNVVAKSVYHLTFQPILGDADVLEALAKLQSKYGPQAALTPLPITTAHFEVTQRFSETSGFSSPFEVRVPNWTGDLHSFSQRFSVILTGKAYDTEPAMSRFMTHPAGNAFVGTMHYGFRAVNTPFNGHALVNVHQFLSKFRAHASAKFGFWGAVDIATAIDAIKDDPSVFVDVVKDAGYESESWKAITEKLVSTLFQPVPPAPDAPAGTPSSLFQVSSSYSQVSVDKKIEISVKESVIKDHSGDIDIQGGGIEANDLNVNIKYYCDMWAHYEVAKQACVDVCEPVLEYYNPATKTCSPAFGN